MTELLNDTDFEHYCKQARHEVDEPHRNDFMPDNKVGEEEIAESIALSKALATSEISASKKCPKPFKNVKAKCHRCNGIFKVHPDLASVMIGDLMQCFTYDCCYQLAIYEHKLREKDKAKP